MKKIIAFVLVSMAAQNLSAPISESDYVCSGRRTPIEGCRAGTEDWLGGAGPAMSAEDSYKWWVATKEGKEHLRKREEERREKVLATILAALDKLPEESQKKAVLGDIFSQSGFSTPPPSIKTSPKKRKPRGDACKTSRKRPMTRSRARAGSSDLVFMTPEEILELRRPITPVPVKG